MRVIIPLILNVLIVGLFLYVKLLPYKDKLKTQYKSVFDFFNSFFTPILNFLRKFIKPFQVGQGLSVDLTHIILLLVLLLFLNNF
ncbi:MAG: YggT family protein [Saprospiraceae bacterium]|nr:YggT family protein [Saprospiraceae bacterium]MBP6567195.1 YggT family protein [Saprospiraceae bacterium]